MSVRPAKTRISLGIRPVWSESSLSAWRKLGSLATHWVHSEDSDQTGRMPRLICLCWVHSHFVGFVISCLICVILYWKPKIKALMRLCGCAGWSVLLSLAYGIRQGFLIMMWLNYVNRWNSLEGAVARLTLCFTNNSRVLLKAFHAARKYSRITMLKKIQWNVNML